MSTKEAIASTDAFRDYLLAWALKKLGRRTFITPERLRTFLKGAPLTDTDMWMIAGALRMKKEDVSQIFGAERMKRAQLRFAVKRGFKPSLVKP